MTTAVKTDNIFSLTTRHVLRPLVRAGEPVSWTLFVLFLVLIVVSVLLNVFGSDAPDSFYHQYFLAFWYGSWALLVLATAGPIVNIARAQGGEIPLIVLIGVGVVHLLTFICISAVVLLQYKKPEAVTGLMAAFAAAVMVGIGWVVQHQTSARSARRANTFGVLMQSRLSKEFQDQLKRRFDYYSAGVLVEAEDAALCRKEGLAKCEASIADRRRQAIEDAAPEFLGRVNGRFDEELALARRKHESLQGVVYLLNFYEFMCAGIDRRELDGELLRDCVAGIVCGLYEDTKHVRAFSRETQEKAFIKLDKIVGARWSQVK